MGMNCPKCGQIDMAQSVPAIVQGSSSTFNYEAPINFVYKGTGGSFMVNKQGRTQSDLANRLQQSIYKEPDPRVTKEMKQFEMDCEQFYGHKLELPEIEGMGCLLATIVVIGLLCIGLGLISTTEKAIFMIIIGMIIAAVPIIYHRLKHPDRDEKKKKYKEQVAKNNRLRKDFITHMHRRWWDSFYCGRCNVVFIPDKPGYMSVYDLKEFTKMENSIATCPKCGTEITVDRSAIHNGVTCWNCKHSITNIHAFEIINPTNREWMVASPGLKLFNEHFGKENGANGKISMAEVASHPQDKALLGLRNTDNKPWEVLLPNGNRVALDQGKAIPLQDGLKIRIGESELTVQG